MNLQIFIDKIKVKINRIKERKPRFANWLKILGGILFVLFFIWYELFVPHPDVPEPDRSYMYYGDIPSVTISFKDADAPVLAGSELESIVSGTPAAISIDEKKAEELKNTISVLKLEKKALEDNINKLREQNSLLSDLNFDIQNRIMIFVKKGRAFDIILSAFIGAIVSVTLSYLLNVPHVREKVYNYLWSNNPGPQK